MRKKSFFYAEDNAGHIWFDLAVTLIRGICFINSIKIEPLTKTITSCWFSRGCWNIAYGCIIQMKDPGQKVFSRLHRVPITESQDNILTIKRPLTPHKLPEMCVWERDREKEEIKDKPIPPPPASVSAQDVTWKSDKVQKMRPQNT